MFCTIIRFCATFKMSVSCVTALNTKRKNRQKNPKKTPRYCLTDSKAESTN